MLCDLETLFGSCVKQRISTCFSQEVAQFSSLTHTTVSFKIAQILLSRNVNPSHGHHGNYLVQIIGSLWNEEYQGE